MDPAPVMADLGEEPELGSQDWDEHQPTADPSNVGQQCPGLYKTQNGQKADGLDHPLFPRCSLHHIYNAATPVWHSPIQEKH